MAIKPKAQGKVKDPAPVGKQCFRFLDLLPFARDRFGAQAQGSWGSKNAGGLRTRCARLIEKLHRRKVFVAATLRKQLGKIHTFQQESPLRFRLHHDVFIIQHSPLQQARATPLRRNPKRLSGWPLMLSTANSSGPRSSTIRLSPILRNQISVDATPSR